MMEALLKKLNYAGQSPLLCSGIPEEQHALLVYLQTLAPVLTDRWEPFGFGLLFATTAQQVVELAPYLEQYAQGDCTLWMLYPKGSSKRYRSEINRDRGWAPLGALGFEPVRQVSLDEDWSALRFRRVVYIKQMRRNPDGALSPEGRSKAERSA